MSDKNWASKALKNRGAIVVVTFAAVVVLSLAPRMISLDEPGLTWDEPVYYWAGRVYLSNVANGNFNPDSWFANSEHPPLAKYLIGLSINLLAPLGYTEVSAARIQAAFLGAFTCGLLLLMVVHGGYPVWLGMLSGLTLSFLPHFLGNTRYAALDGPLTFFMTLAMYTLMAAPVEKNRFVIMSGLALGLALATKINAVEIPLIMFLWLFINSKEALHTRLRSSLLRTFLTSTIGFIVLLFSWPFLWKDTLSRLIWFLNFHFSHFPIATFYLGETYSIAPWHYPIVMLSVTTPVAILFEFFVGLVFMLLKLRHTLERRLDSLFLLWFLVPVMRTAVSFKYDGIRLFLEAVPAMVGIASLGFYNIANVVLKRLKPQIGIVVVAFLAVSMVAFSVAHDIEMYPFFTSYFNELVGGLRSAKDYFEPTYWGDSYKYATEWMDVYRPGSIVVVPIADHLVRYYARNIRVTSNVYEALTEDNSYFMFMSRVSFYSWSPYIEYLLENAKPVYTVEIEDVDLAYVYSLEDLKSFFSSESVVKKLKRASEALKGRLVSIIDISKHANMGLKDDIPNDGKGGWTDEGDNDMRCFPTGLQEFPLLNKLSDGIFNIPFYISPSNRSVISVRGGARPLLPESLEVPLNLSHVRWLVFMHACAWAEAPGTTIASYFLEYDDGTRLKIPIVVDDNVRDWWSEPIVLENAVPAWVGSNTVHAPVSVYVMPWENPYPDKAVLKLRVKSEGKNSVFVLVALTAVSGA